jgi:hypothetical protein
MSKFVKVRTELRDVALVKKALDDLKLRYEEDVRYRHYFSGANEAAALVVHARSGNFGLKPNAEGALEVMGDSMQMAGVRQLLAQVQQRYAYHMVVQETEKAGFALVEEQTGSDQVIRMTVRRWN